MKDDLISRAAAIAWFFRPYSNEENYSNLDVERALKAIPAVDAAPATHGQWIGYPECLGYNDAYHDEHIVCSKCHSVWNIIDNDTERFDYCPACGAKMSKE